MTKQSESPVPLRYCKTCGLVEPKTNPYCFCEQESPMTKPPLNTYIEWDGSETPPVPENTDITYWTESGEAYREQHDDGCFWETVTAYLVHSYPPEDEVRDVWVLFGAVGCASLRYSSAGARNARAQGDTITHLRFTNGVAEIVSQEKA